MKLTQNVEPNISEAFKGFYREMLSYLNKIGDHPTKKDADHPYDVVQFGELMLTQM